MRRHDMKRLSSERRHRPLLRTAAAAAAAALLLLSCMCMTSCTTTESGNTYLFAFLSVRLKGNGDGTIRAYAKNEFDIGPSIKDVELSVYYSEEYRIETSGMEIVGSTQIEYLSAFSEYTMDVPAQDGYFCALISYPLNGQTRLLQSETIHYDATGTRV